MTKSVVAIMAVVVLVAAASYALAADDVKVTGTVSVVKDDAGAVKSASVKAGDVTYNVVLDDKGKEVAKLDGKKVEITGTVEEKDAVKNLTVKECKEVVEKKPE